MKGRFLACLWEINNIDVMFQQRKCIVVELRKWPDIDLMIWTPHLLQDYRKISGCLSRFSFVCSFTYMVLLLYFVSQADHDGAPCLTPHSLVYWTMFDNTLLTFSSFHDTSKRP